MRPPPSLLLLLTTSSTRPQNSHDAADQPVAERNYHRVDRSMLPGIETHSMIQCPWRFDWIEE